ncbi:MAG: MATE family efflux transporter [Opitutae bacterium]|nr:MATE family efflux transporter [Opitutae bacterium]
MLNEFKKTAKLSLPITLGMIGQGLFGLIDALMIGQILGELALAAATLGITVTILPIYCAIGFCIAIPVLSAQARGSNNAHELPHILRHGLFVVLVFTIFCAIALAIFISHDGLHALGQPEDVIVEARDFSTILAWAVVPAGIFQAIKVFLDATSRPWVALLWMTIGLVLNIFLNWVLMTGALGFPNLGLAGAAWGTLFSRAISLVGMCLHGKLAFEWKAAISRVHLRRNLAIGIPSAIQILAEGGLFIAAPIAMGWLGARALAANQVAMNISTLAYMIPLGVSQAASIRVGEAFGERNWQKIKKISAGILIFSGAFMAIYSTVVISLRHKIPVFYNVEPETAELAANVLVIVGTYSIFDGLQCASAGILRGLSDVRPVMWGSIICYWVISAPLALLLAFPLGFGGCGIWAGMAAGLASAAAIFLLSIAKNFRKARADFATVPPKNIAR